MNRPFLAVRAAAARRERRVHPRIPRYMAHPTGRPIGSRREPRDSAWTGVIAIALSIAFLLWIVWYAPQMPRRESPPDPRGYVGVRP